MKLFKFYRQCLTALPVFFVFMACDQLLPPPAGGTGKRVEPIIRSVRVRDYIDYGETSGTRSGDGESRIVGEPIIQDLGGGMLAEITIGEDISALRDDEPVVDNPLANGVKFRVIAVDSNNKVYSYADYESNEDKQSYDLINNTKLHVLDGVEYSYIFISYNNTTLPPAPKEGETLANITVDAGSHDLMWKTINDPQTDSNGVPDLNFGDLVHKLAKIKVLKLKSNETFTNVVANSISLNAGNSGSFNLKEGEFISSTGNTVFTGWPTSPNTTEVTSDEITFLPKKNCTLTIPKNTFILGNTSQPKVDIAVGSDKFKFLAGGRYTVTITFKAVTTSNKFAGSNIYWDDTTDPSNPKLTFVDHGEGSGTNATYYQGVYFKWGSLIGVSPVGNYSNNTSTGTVLYWPNVSKRTWESVTGGTAWVDIPYSFASTPVGDDAYSLLVNPDFEHYKGDICNYLKPGYRMPTANELVALGTGSSGSGDWTWNGSGSATSSDATGRQVFTQFGTFSKTGTDYVLPASGYRYFNSGALFNVGYYGYYWSGSADSGTSNAYGLGFGSSGDADTYYADRSYGLPVRCVKN